MPIRIYLPHGGTIIQLANGEEITEEEWAKRNEPVVEEEIPEPPAPKKRKTTKPKE